MVHYQKLRRLDRTTAGVGIPKDELRDLGLIEESESGEIRIVEQHFKIRRNGDELVLEPCPPEHPHAAD